MTARDLPDAPEGAALAPKRPLRRAAILAGQTAMVIVLIGAAGIVYLKSPAGLDFIESKANGAKAGRYGSISLKNLTGDPFGAMHADRLALSDENGEWVVASDAAVRINAWAIFGGVLQLKTVSANDVSVLRRPVLSPPKKDTGKALVDFELQSLTLPHVQLADGVAGHAATMSISGAGLTRRNGDGAAQATIKRIDSDSDTLSLDWRSIHDSDMRLSAKGYGKSGGVFASLLEAPKGADVSLSASASGSGKAGNGAATLSIGGEGALQGEVAWRDRLLRLKIDGNLSKIAQTKELSARLGGPFALNFSLLPDDEDLSQARLDARFANVTLEANGAVNVGEQTAPKGLDVKIDAPRLEALGKEFAGLRGPASVEGKAFAANGGYGFKGRAALEEAARAGFKAQKIEGPLELGYNDKEIAFQGVFDAKGFSAAQRELAGLIGPAPKIDAAGSYIRKTGEVRIALARITGAAANLQASGEIDPDGPIRLDGALTITNLTVAQKDLKGRADMRFGAMRLGRDDDLIISAQGTAAGVSGPNQIARLLGAKPRIQFEAEAPQSGGWRIQRATLDGQNLRFGAKGSSSSFGALNVDYEAKAKGPFQFGDTVLNGDIDSFGKLSGTKDNPRLTLQASAAKLVSAGMDFSNVVFEMDAPSLSKKIAGRARLEADSAQGPLAVNAVFDVVNGRTALSEIDATWAGATFSGDIALGGGAPMVGKIAGSGAVAPFTQGSGEFTANLALANARGSQGVTLNAAVQNAVFDSGKGSIESARLHLTGTDRALTLRANANGNLDKPFSIALNGPLTFDNKRRTALLDISGRYGATPIASITPVSISTGPKFFSVKGALEAGTGNLNVDWLQNGETLNADLTLVRAPAGLGGFLSPRLRLSGELSGNAKFSGSGKNLSGAAAISLDKLGPEGATGSGLDGAVALVLTDGRIKGNLDAKSANGLVIQGEADVPAQVSAQPFKIAFDPKAAASGKLLVQGPAKDGWRIFGPTGQSLEGDVKLNAVLAGTIGKPELTGAGTLRNGKFEDSASGLKLRDVQSDMRFAGSTLNIDTASGNDSANGRAQAKGVIAFNEKGVNADVEVQLADLRFLDRDEALATGSGKLNYTAHPGEAARISGNIVTNRVELSAANAAAAPPVISVTHKNLPAHLRRRNMAEQRQQLAKGKPLQIDIAISAPARLFVRGHGLESEWSFDSKLQGTLQNPILIGEAELIRGDYELLGKRFALDSGVINFNGSPKQARLNISGSRTTTDLTAIVKVTGTINHPDIKLTSSPSLPNDEVLARVLFDRGAGQLSALEGAQLAAGLAALSGNSAFDVAGAIRKVGLDRVNFGADENGAATVSGGKYIASNVYLEVAGGASGEPAAQVEWEPKKNLSLVSRFSGTQTSRFSVRWKKDY